MYELSLNMQFYDIKAVIASAFSSEQNEPFGLGLCLVVGRLLVPQVCSQVEVWQCKVLLQTRVSTHHVSLGLTLVLLRSSLVYLGHWRKPQTVN